MVTPYIDVAQVIVFFEWVTMMNCVQVRIP